MTETNITTPSLEYQPTVEDSSCIHADKRQRIEPDQEIESNCDNTANIQDGEDLGKMKKQNNVVNLIESLTDGSEEVVEDIIDDEIASQDSVEVVSKPADTIEDIEDDDEINILKSNVTNPNISFPHLREDCGVHSFNNKNYCEKCFCFCCDVPANCCKQWDEHYNAHSKDEVWIQKKNEMKGRGDVHKIISLDLSQQEEDSVGEIRIPTSGSILDALSTNFSQVLKTNQKEIVNKIDGDIPQLCLNNNFYLEGIKLGWPFPSIMTPQRQIAIRIIKGLKQRQHVVLESPTGTGKSAAILCSVLAWQRYYRMSGEKASQVIYCSRTHAQTAQIIHSLRKTPYRPQMAVLGSRSKLCINREVNRYSSDVNRGCRMRVRNTLKARRKGYKDHDAFSQSDDDNDEIHENNRQTNAICPHYKQLENYATSQLTYNSFIPSNTNCIELGGEKTKSGIHDIEDLVAFGQKPAVRRNIAIYRHPSEKFGMQLSQVQRSRMLKVANVYKGGAVYREGSIQEGDLVVNINNQSCCSSSFEENIARVQNTSIDEPLLIDTIPTNHLNNDTAAVCPYYISQLLSSHAEIVFAPYEYMLDENIRKRVNFSLEDAVVVLDEAHNIEEKLRSNGSIEVEEERLRNLVTMLRGYDNGYNGEFVGDVLKFVVDIVNYLKNVKRKFEDDYALGKYTRSLYNPRENYQVYYYGPLATDRKKSNGCARFIQDAKLDSHNFAELKGSIDSLLSKLQQHWEKFLVFMEHLEPLLKVLSALMEPEHYFISAQVKKSERDTIDSPWLACISINLLNPALLFRPLLQKCRSVILASGTLAPIDSLCAELDLKPSLGPPSTQQYLTKNDTMTKDRLQVRPEILEANHIINMKKQLLATSIGFFPDGTQIFASKKNYVQESFQMKLGMAIATIVENVPSGGVLVFLPNKSLIRACECTWKNSFDDDVSIWERLVASKGEVMIEDTKTAHEFEELKEQYADTIRSKGSCILLAVYRGRMSEGISFNDNNARAVICVGIPFAPFDVDVKAKQAYNDNQRRFAGRSLLNGMEWYRQDAFRALSQALGRCIRHSKDYGTIILMDARHCREEERRYLPKWFKNHIRNVDVKANMQGFYTQCNNVDNLPIYGGWKGFVNEIKQFFDEAPIFVNNL